MFILGLIVPGETDAAFVRGDNAAEDLVLVAQVLVHRVREVVVAVAAKAAHRSAEGALPMEADQFLRAMHGEHAQQSLIEKREDSRIGADAERERNDGGERKAG